MQQAIVRTAPLEEAPVPAPRILMEAIARRLTVTATYNGTRSLLAPHILYTRAGQLYCGAVVVSRDGVPPREAKLGIFKVDGISALAIGDASFAPDAGLFDPADARFAGNTLFAVEF